MKEHVLILGAHSDIGRALSRIYAQKGFDLFLAARKSDRLAADVSDLEVRYQARATAVEFDAAQLETHAAFFDSLDPKPSVVISVVGYLGEQENTQVDAEDAQRTLITNFNGCVSILDIAANAMEKEGKGTIIGISSVAGERGRASNYHYGSAKAGFTAYLSGLRNRLAKKGVHVLTVKPGFVDTKMTEGMDLPGPITAKPDKVAKDIFKASKKQKNVLYTLWMWKWIMMIIRNIPEFIFKKMSL